ncbi:uncharacterized protein F5147DRAFT_607921 [Suillus discolor]|uniref:Mmc1 C-terminal domain-containing protein n=1 Tax=Suillus discolor TaxID=1912936 RepID=A0A9P7JXD3_9AGAM|nr:uncharacterized protein F5147DRAFT_607921 [Suillus discolor]KAG2113952.1 hypothetical protein F5147DRAFT_607921 [Suillus discolor]
MPSCLATRHHVLRTILSPRDLSIELSVLRDAKQSRSFVTGRRRTRNASSCTRAYSSSAQTSDYPLGKKTSSSKHEVSALLHRISAFLPRALPGSNTTDGRIQSSQLLSKLLSEVDADLCSPPEARTSARVVVCGADQWAGSHELITALLENPFTTDEAYSDILRNRWKNQSAYLTIEYRPSTSLVNGTLTIPASWLQQYPFPIQLTEISSLSSHPSLPKTLLKGDVLIFICNPLTKDIPALISNAQHILQRPNTILVLTASSTSEHALDYISKELAAANCTPGKILAVDPIRALEAVSALKADPSSPAAIQRYQEDFMGSRISLLGDVLAGMLGLKDSGSTSSLLAIRTQSALIQMRSALYASARSVSQARLAIDRIFTGASELQCQVEEVRARTDREVLVESGIDEALLRGSKEMKAVLESLTWLKMVWRVDEIDSLVSSALDRYWCRELENQLILQTGRLASTQASLTSSTFSQLKKLASPSPSPSPSPAFHSPILDNHLRQLTHSPTYALTPNTLTRPIQARRSQLTQHTTTRLHRDAQNAVLGAFGGMSGGAGIAWWLAFGESALSIGTGSETGTALGAGALVAVASIRWAVGKWERAKRKWVEDADRVGEGLKRDLKATLERGIEKNVAVVPMAAYEGLRELAGKQQEEIDVVRSDLISMQADVEALETVRPS